MNFLKKIINTSTPIIVGCIVGFFLCWFFIGNSNFSNSCGKNLRFIKPSLDCESLDDKSDTLESLKNKLEISIDGFKKTGKAKRISVFVRDLNTSRFAGVNDSEIYYMASLLKTPLLIGGFKLAEVEPKILDQSLIYNGVPDLYNDQIISVSNKLKKGETYTIKDLMNRAVVYSDNTAAQILLDYYPEGFLDRIMQALGVQIVKPTGEVEDFVTARTYANIFRILYNSSYLTREYSNQALEILSKTEFSNGITAKLPKNLTIAHKFAERTLVNGDNSVALEQIHECGLVYLKDPYILCILTEGDNYEYLEEVIRDISLNIYNELSGTDSLGVI